MELGECLAITLSATAAAAIAASDHLHRPLRGILTAHLQDEDLAAFWAAFAQVFAVLIPLLVELLVFAVRPLPVATDAIFVVGLMTWGLGGLVAAIVVVGIGVVVLGGFRGRPVYVDHDQADDLNRLLERVRELRAREVVRRADARR